MLLARMAEAVYWAGRYLERAEDTARIVQVHGETHIDLAERRQAELVVDREVDGVVLRQMLGLRKAQATSSLSYMRFGKALLICYIITHRSRSLCAGRHVKAIALGP